MLILLLNFKRMVLGKTDNFIRKNLKISQYPSYPYSSLNESSSILSGIVLWFEYGMCPSAMVYCPWCHGGMVSLVRLLESDDLWEVNSVENSQVTEDHVLRRQFSQSCFRNMFLDEPSSVWDIAGGCHRWIVEMWSSLNTAALVCMPGISATVKQNKPLLTSSLIYICMPMCVHICM